MKAETSNIDVLIRSHPSSADHVQAIVTTKRGYSYSCTWAEPFPDETTVRQTWFYDRKAFTPYYS